tara:strand:- start:294 stop:653 length:360 start_codon:yes stop_codon:yes gene_type:complete
MSAGRYDILIEQGATLSLDIDYKDSSNNLINLTSGYTAAMKIKDTIGGTTIASLTNGNGITFHSSSSATPNIAISIAHGTTAGYDFDDAVYDLELTNTSTGTVSRIVEGKVTLSRNVTA